MADSRKSPTSNALLTHSTAVIRQHVKSGDRLVVGLSGGVDSVVLTDLLRRLSKKLGFELAALHVNHQINPAAARWAAFCGEFCRQHAIPFTVVRVNVPRGNSLEAAARSARYQAFSARSADFVVLGHNLDDQAETVFLQLLRGAGVKGVSAMPVAREEPDVTSGARRDRSPSILRPLLDVPRSEIETYARRRRLKWVEDDSNADIGFDRNFLRHDVLPVIARRYPAYRTSLLRASRHFAEAAQLLDELAASDAQFTARGLKVSGLRGLSVARVKNVLRHFLAREGMTMPSSVRLAECARQLLHGVRGTRLAVDLGGHQLRRFADELLVVPAVGTVGRDFTRIWRGENKVHLPELGGTLVLKKCRGVGINLEKLLAHPVTIRLRQGGERFHPHPARPRRSLKNLLQEAHVPPWQRDRLPLLCQGTTLVYVPGVGIAPEFRALAGEPALDPCWEPG